MLIGSVMICGAGCSGCLYDSFLLCRKCLILSIPSSWGMFVYSDETSMDTRMQSAGWEFVRFYSIDK